MPLLELAPHRREQFLQQRLRQRRELFRRTLRTYRPESNPAEIRNCCS